MDEEIRDIGATVIRTMTSGDEHVVVAAAMDWKFAFFDATRVGKGYRSPITFERRDNFFISKSFLKIAEFLGCSTEGDFKVVRITVGKDGQFDLKIDHDPELDPESGLPKLN